MEAVLLSDFLVFTMIDKNNQIAYHRSNITARLGRYCMKTQKK